MNEREALLRAVCENPDDDTPRLVFADWLQEHGDDDRAEFIRLQCRREGGAALTQNEWSLGFHRELELLQLHESRWRAELPTSEAPCIEWGLFERGFPLAPCSGLTVSAWERGLAVTEVLADISDCSRLDWDRLYWSAPFVRLYLEYLTNWHVPLCRPEAARLKGASLIGCVVDGHSVEALLTSGQQFTGYLYLKQDELDPGLEARLRSAFGERYSRETFWDV